MRSIVQLIENGIRGLRADLDLADVLLQALEQGFKTAPNQLQEYVRRARRLSYSSTIVSCYGLIEQTVDSLISASAEAYNSIYPSYGDIPEPVRRQHRELLLACLRDGERARTRSIIDDKTALSALALEANDKPALVASAFTLSTANYRLPYIQGLLSRIGINGANGLYHGLADEALAKSGFANYESFLADLVQRRNDLAHSYGDDDIVDRELLAAYVEIAGQCLLDLERIINLFAIKSIRDWDIEPVGIVVRTWSGRVGIKLEVDSVTVGDRLLLYKNDWCTSHNVDELQSENVTSDSFAYAGEHINVAARIDSVPANAEGCEAFVLPAQWSEYWPGFEKWGVPHAR